MIQLLVASAWFTWQSVHKEYLNLPDRQMHMQDRVYTKSIKQNTRRFDRRMYHYLVNFLAQLTGRNKRVAVMIRVRVLMQITLTHYLCPK
jgi:hypothetical protein